MAEYRNIPVDKAVGLISEDYQKFTFSSGGQQPSSAGGLGGPLGGGMGGIAPVRESVPVFNVRDGVGSASHQRNGSSLPPPSQQLAPVIAPSSQEKRLPEDVAYVLRTTLTEGGVQFLSPSADRHSHRLLFSRTGKDDFAIPSPAATLASSSSAAAISSICQQW